MKITQQDIAQLRDDDVKRLALIADDVKALGGPLASFWTAFQEASIRALQERRRALAYLEQDLLDEDEAVGSIVGPDDDPVGDAMRAMRGKIS